MSNMLALNGIYKTYTQGDVALPVLQGVDVSLAQGESVALVGQSGSGKSTLLHMAGLLDIPDKGEVLINGVEATRASDAERTRLRREHIGFVYQFHHLLGDFSALENVVLPLLIRGVVKTEAAARAKEMLIKVGLAERLHHKPFKLSGGEQQRVAIARALVGNPRVILADEPTGSLDAANGAAVMNVLLEACKQQGAALLVATHNPDIASACSRIQRLETSVKPAL